MANRYSRRVCTPVMRSAHHVTKRALSPGPFRKRGTSASEHLSNRVGVTLLALGRILGQNINDGFRASWALDLTCQNLLGIDFFAVETFVGAVILVQGRALQLQPGKHPLTARVA